MKNKDKMIQALERAISLGIKFIEKAKSDEDFMDYWDDPDFTKMLIESKTPDKITVK